MRPWLISSLQSHLPSVQPPHRGQSALAAGLITSPPRLKSSDDSPFVRPSLTWPLFLPKSQLLLLPLCILCSSNIEFPALPLKIAFLFYPPTILHWGAPQACSANQSARVNRTAVWTSGGSNSLQGSEGPSVPGDRPLPHPNRSQVRISTCFCGSLVEAVFSREDRAVGRETMRATYREVNRMI